MRIVLPNQQYSLLVNYGMARGVFLVERIENGRAHGKLVASGKPYSIDVSVLAHGHRSSRLVVDADGTPVKHEKVRRVRIDARMREAARLHAKGVGPVELGSRFGVSRSTILGWLLNVRKETETRC